MADDQLESWDATRYIRTTHQPLFLILAQNYRQEQQPDGSWHGSPGDSISLNILGLNDCERPCTITIGEARHIADTFNGLADQIDPERKIAAAPTPPPPEPAPSWLVRMVGGSFDGDTMRTAVSSIQAMQTRTTDDGPVYTIGTYAPDGTESEDGLPIYRLMADSEAGERNAVPMDMRQ